MRLIFENMAQNMTKGCFRNRPLSFFIFKANFSYLKQKFHIIHTNFPYHQQRELLIIFHKVKIWRKKSRYQEMALLNIFWKMHVLSYFTPKKPYYDSNYATFFISRAPIEGAVNNLSDKNFGNFCNQRHLLPINSAYFVIWIFHFSISPKMK